VPHPVAAAAELEAPGFGRVPGLGKEAQLHSRPVLGEKREAGPRAVPGGAEWGKTS
jgi:hypothetical protein